MEDVTVIGAGTAGLIAAKRLGRLGISTTVYEQKAVPGVPVRASGILSISGLATLGIRYREAVTNVLDGALIHAGGESMRIKAPHAIAVVLDRKRLNAICMEEAMDAGAQVVLGKRKALTAPERGRVMVGADGVVSGVARHFGMGSIPRHVITYKAIYRTRCSNPHSVELFFDNAVTPGLFGWLCPNSEDELEVGLGLESGHGDAKRAFGRFIQCESVREALDDARFLEGHASLIPMRLRERIVDERRRVLLVGDAAGQVKPSTGGGIIFGGNAALMAADAIKAHMENGTPLGAYSRAYKGRFGMDTAAHALANRLYSNMSAQNIAFLIRVLRGLHADAFLGKYGEMDMPSRVIRNVLFGRSSMHI